MKQFMITLSAVIVAMLLVLIVLPIAVISGLAAAAHPHTHGDVVVSIDLREKMSDQSQSAPFDFFTGKGLSTLEVVQTLHRAADDPHVKAVFIRLPEGGMSPAAAEEIRDAIIYVRGAAKPVIAHSQGLYPDTMVIASYMLGASASELWMQPRSSFQVTGISTSTMFMKRAFDKYGITAQYEQRAEFKNAVNPYLYDDYTDAHREATLGWMTSIYQSMLKDIAHDRRMDVTKVQSTIEAGPYGAEQALDLGLISHLGQVHDAQEAALKRGDENTEIIDIHEYERTAPTVTTGDTIAVINGEGAIMTGRGSGSGFGSDETSMMSDTVSDAFYAAIKDKSVKAIVFRVSSPGGSDTASEQIANAMQAAKESGKPVVVSMGEYAASGGYWISSGASAIVADPSTLTGSIGVFGGKIAYGDALAKFGIDMKDLTVGGQNSNTFSPSQGFTPEQHAALSSWIDQIYNGFIVHVSAGRNIPEDTVRDIAKGRVWTGDQALGLRLVDKLGGFYDAVDEAKSLAKLTGDVHLVNYPASHSMFGDAGESVRMSLTGLKTLSFLGWAMSDPKAEAVMNNVADERLREQGATVMAPQAYQPTTRPQTPTQP